VLSAALAVVTAVVVVVVAAIAADRLAAAAVMRRIAGRIGAASGAADPPEVRIAGAVFLTQLLAGCYREVRVTLAAFTAGGIEFDRLTARLTQVRMPLGRPGAESGVVAGQMTATAVIPLSVLGSRLPPGLALRYEGGELVIVSSVLPMPVSGVLRVSADAQVISLTPRVLGIPSLVGFAIALPAMPPELAIESVGISAAGLEVSVRGDNVHLADLADPPADRIDGPLTSF